jgi:chromosome segregation ATPase
MKAMNPLQLRAAWTCAALTTLCAASGAMAQAAAKPDRIMTRDELRACMVLKQQADSATSQVRERQQAFVADRDALKADKTQLSRNSEELATRGKDLGVERDAIVGATSALSAKAQAAKSDEDKADVAQQRAQLADRASRFDKDVVQFNSEQKALLERVSALNTRTEAINERAKTVNDGTDEAAELSSNWRNRCGNRRYREEDEAELRKELGLSK